MEDFDYADTALPPAVEQEFLMENLCSKKNTGTGYTPPATRSASKRWKRIHEQSMMMRLDEMHIIKKQNAQMSKEAARKIIRKIPVEILAKEWLSKEDATVDMRAYLVDHVLPTLILGVERLLKEVDEKGLTTNRFEPEFNPINFLAQYLMRNNPRFSNFAEASPYVRGLREVSEEIKQELFTFEDNRLARIKAEARRKRNEREKYEQQLREEKERRQEQLMAQFKEWNVPTDNNRVELSLLQNALRSFAEIAEQLPDELREVAKFGHPLEPTDETGRTLAVKEFAQYISLFVEDLPIEVFEQFIIHMSKCAAAHRASAERENRRIILSNLFLLCDHGGIGLLDRHRILTLFERFWDLIKNTNTPKGTLRNPRRWPVVEVDEVDDAMFDAWEKEPVGGLTENEVEESEVELGEIDEKLNHTIEAAVSRDTAAREKWKMEQLSEKSEGYRAKMYKYNATDFTTLAHYPLMDTLEAPKKELHLHIGTLDLHHDLYETTVTKLAFEREISRLTKLGRYESVVRMKNFVGGEQSGTQSQGDKSRESKDVRFSIGGTQSNIIPDTQEPSKSDDTLQNVNAHARSQGPAEDEPTSSGKANQNKNRYAQRESSTDDEGMSSDKTESPMEDEQISSGKAAQNRNRHAQSESSAEEEQLSTDKGESSTGDEQISRRKTSQKKKRHTQSESSADEEQSSTDKGESSTEDEQISRRKASQKRNRHAQSESSADEEQFSTDNGESSTEDEQISSGKAAQKGDRHTQSESSADEEQLSTDNGESSTEDEQISRGKTAQKGDRRAQSESSADEELLISDKTESSTEDEQVSGGKTAQKGDRHIQSESSADEELLISDKTESSTEDEQMSSHDATQNRNRHACSKSPTEEEDDDDDDGSSEEDETPRMIHGTQNPDLNALNKNNNTISGQSPSGERDSQPTPTSSGSRGRTEVHSDVGGSLESLSSARSKKKVRFEGEKSLSDGQGSSISQPRKHLRKLKREVAAHDHELVDVSTSTSDVHFTFPSPYMRLPPLGMSRYMGSLVEDSKDALEADGEGTVTAESESDQVTAEGGDEETVTASEADTGKPETEATEESQEEVKEEKKEGGEADEKPAKEEAKTEEGGEKQDAEKGDGQTSTESPTKADGGTGTDEDAMLSEGQGAGTSGGATIAEAAQPEAVTSAETEKEMAARESEEKDKDESIAAEELDVDITAEIAESQSKSALKRQDPQTNATATGRQSVTFAGNTAFDRERTGITTNSRSQSQMSAFDESVLNVPQFVQLIETFLGHHPIPQAFQKLVEFIKEGYVETEEERTERLVKARKEAISAKRKLMMDNLFEKWDNDGSGFLEMDDVFEVMIKFKDGQEIDTIKTAQIELKKKAKYQDQRLSKREFRQFVEAIADEMPGSESFDVFVEFLTNSVERSYAERIRGEARKKWLQQIVSAALVSGTSMEPVYKAVFQALYKDAETHGGEKRISASIAMLEVNKSEPARGDLLLRYAACTPEDCQYMLGKALHKNMKGISFQVVESGKPIHVPRVSSHGNIYFWNYDRHADEREGSFIVIPLKDMQKRVFGTLGIDTLIDPHKKAIFITHEIQFFQGVAKSFSIAYRTVDTRRKLLRITESAISWIQRRCPHIAEITVYLVEPNLKGDNEPLLRKMMITDKKGAAVQVTEIIRLERKDNLFRDYLFKCIDNSETIVADAYGDRHTASPLRDNNGKAVGVLDISIGKMKALPLYENKEAQRMLRLLQKAHMEITREAEGDDSNRVLEAEQDDNTRMDIMFDRLMLMELRENVSRLDPQSFAELKSYLEPPRLIIDILRATLAVFKVDMVGEGELDDWNTIKHSINNDLIQQIRSYDPTVSANLIETEKVEKYLKGVPHGEVGKYGSIPAQQLYNWVFVCISLIEHTRKMRENAEGNVLVSGS